MDRREIECALRSTKTGADQETFTGLPKERLDNRHARGQLLSDDTNGGDHGHTPVVELLSAHAHKGLVIVGTKAQRIVL